MWNVFPKDPGDEFFPFTDINTNTNIVTRYGDIESTSTGIFTPAACKFSCNTVIPPNKYAPIITFETFQFANTTIASAIQPVPAVNPSVHCGTLTSEI